MRTRRLCLRYKKGGKSSAPGFITESYMNWKRPLLLNKRQSLLKRIPRQSLTAVKLRGNILKKARRADLI
jgi:hypothetical protein